jgi:hypothetical protein
MKPKAMSFLLLSNIREIATKISQHKGFKKRETELGIENFRNISLIFQIMKKNA